MKKTKLERARERLERSINIRRTVGLPSPSDEDVRTVLAALKDAEARAAATRALAESARRVQGIAKRVEAPSAVQRAERAVVRAAMEAYDAREMDFGIGRSPSELDEACERLSKAKKARRP